MSPVYFAQINYIYMVIFYLFELILMQGKHRGFAFIEFETVEDAAAAIDNMVNNSETLFDRLEIIFNPQYIFS